MKMLITTEQLRKWCGYERKRDIEKWLRDNGIAWRRGKNGEICTTLDAINESLQGSTKDKEVTF
jgi:hypothetical protein